MNSSTDALKLNTLQTMLDMARIGHAPDTAARLAGYISAYFLDTPAEDLGLFTPVDLYGAVLSHWRFAAERRSQSVKVRAYNPAFEEDGWQSTHTIIEIVNDDMPFLVDSVCMALNRLGLTLHLVLHPVFRVQRDERGRLIQVSGADVDLPAESFIHIEVDRQTSEEALRAMESDLRLVLDDVRASVDDWPATIEQLDQLIGEIENNPPRGSDGQDVSEAAIFLKWLRSDHFTFLGYRNYDLVSQRGGKVLQPSGPGLGILREALGRDDQTGLRLTGVHLERALGDRDMLLLTKANSRATVHRSGYLDHIAVRRFNKAGNIIGEHRFLGLYTSVAYSTNPRLIPVLRNKISAVLEDTHFPPLSHKGKSLLHVLENYQRDELWEIQPHELRSIALGIVHLQERQVVRVFVREDRFGRYVSCLVYVPRDNYNTEVRSKMQQILMQAFAGVSAEFNVNLSESVLALIHFIVRTPNGIPSDYDVASIEAQLLHASRRWKDHLQMHLIEHFGEEQGNLLFRHYADAFPVAYHEDFLPRAAVTDIEHIQSLKDESDLGLSLYNFASATTPGLHLKVFRIGQPIALSTSLDILENLGVQVLDEHPYRVDAIGRQPVWISDFGLQPTVPIVSGSMRMHFQETFALAFKGKIDNDGFNRLVLLADLDWREVNVLRAYCHYLKQIGATFSKKYIETCLCNHPGIAHMLVALFHARLSPVPRGDITQLLLDLRDALNAVPSLDDDRILSAFLAMVLATLRTNYYQRDHNSGKPKPWLALKLDPLQIQGMPEPKPWAEIYVYSARVEGVHLRGGAVARGGLRWSDRQEDFRTEVLGLMKAQRVKNSVIVPVGAKGGFICKQLDNSSRDAFMAEGVACYEWFIRGLLDITDNLVNGKVVPPDGVIRHDGDDPYLVVAADKGTATFSDIANRIAREYQYWLDDAFASGGSQGYDHKKIGITARGAWEATKRHFRELNIDVQSQRFTVIGIGDMSGDVFGNGMLLSPSMQLIAAFDHRHIFIDPDPDPATSFAERQRLFALPTSSWADYKAELISTGGGVYPRSAKLLHLSLQAQAALGTSDDTLTPNELIKEILKAPADLLYNGGIGTYVKATLQSHTEANDRGNDAVRISASDLRVKVVVEGGNLGFTQPARVEFALAGGRIHTDAIDNSGGVDCSDHEVNIKILLNHVVAAGDMTQKQRNQLLSDMTEDVAALVLHDNEQQTMSLQVSAVIAPNLLHVHVRYLQYLEKTGRLKRASEYLPTDEELHERRLAHRGLVKPELAVLMAYAKMTIYPEILASDLPREFEALPALARYFPPRLVAECSDALPSHYLKHEIIATVMTNDIVNRMGATFLFRLNDETGANIATIVRTWHAACRIFQAAEIWAEIEALGNECTAEAQLQMHLEIRRLLERATRWILRNFPSSHEIDDYIDDYISGVSMFRNHLPQLLISELHPDIARFEKQLIDAGVPWALAATLARSEALLAALDIMQIDNSVQLGLDTVAEVYFIVGEEMQLDWVRHAINALPRENRWQTLARISLRDDIYRLHRALVALILQGAPIPIVPPQLIEQWRRHHEESISKVMQFIGELKTQSSTDLAMLSAALREIRNHLLSVA